ncbi:hypothetical protein [Paenibacillus sp. Soil750]|uniref:hypothetical protein n=1 Tax=Paenibacillus sp. Soil750 TaxID=1736398 RepID=UPI0006F3B11A|nr:hypothetical protein [Paenibacillus sp. Soil750]KRE70417.1 hypothetical protein ASL11_11935 [Paenibacillus sp. Soil750]
MIQEAAFLFSFVMDSVEVPTAPLIEHDDNRLIVKLGNKDEETAFRLHKRPAEMLPIRILIKDQLEIIRHC